ncbi:MAG: hypothetical protein M1819_006045 [Sarea resinae]|nr:MAG: hypothetical protein M1819_006045 [Sarea resinae]
MFFSSTIASATPYYQSQRARALQLSARPSAWRPQVLAAMTPGFPASSIRFNSTTSTPSPKAEAVAAAPTTTPIPPSTTDAVAAATTPASPSPSSIDAITSDDIASIPEHIGYLKELGLDYGWGPTAFIEYMIEHVHVYSGTPWWASILITVAVVRLAMLKPTMDATDTSARLAAAKPFIEPVKERMMAASRSGDRAATMVARAEMSQIHQKAGIQTWKAFVPLLQVPLGFGTFRLMRGMATLPVPGLETGGLWWATDLTVADPYFILPVATGLAMWYNAKKGAEMNMMNAQMKNIFVYGLPILTAAFMLPWPAALQYSFFFTSLYGIGQALLLKSEGFRKWAGIYPMPKPQAPNTAASGLQSKINLAPTYQAPTVGSSIKGSGTGMPPPASKPKSFLDGAKAEIKVFIDEAKKSAMKLQGESSETNPGKRTAAEKKRAEAYEERRQKEIEHEKWMAEMDARDRQQQKGGQGRQARRRSRREL